MWQSLPHSKTLDAADPWCRDLCLGGSWERSQPELYVSEIRIKLQGTIWEAKLCMSFSVSRVVSSFTFTISIFALNLWHGGICPPQIFLKLWEVSPNTRILQWVFWGWWDHEVFGVPAQVLLRLAVGAKWRPGSFIRSQRHHFFLVAAVLKCKYYNWLPDHWYLLWERFKCVVLQELPWVRVGSEGSCLGNYWYKENFKTFFWSIVSEYEFTCNIGTGGRTF